LSHWLTSLLLLLLLTTCYRHDVHGIISVQTAQLMEEVAETPAPVTAPDATAAAADSMDVEGKEAESKGDSKVLGLCYAVRTCTVTFS
jgi:hypothetical protein